MVGAVIWESSQLAFVFLAACVCVCARIALPGLRAELHLGGCQNYGPLLGP